MAAILRTPLYDRHIELGAQMVPFGGWDMPVQYPAGILQEHLETRLGAGLFDVSHMGRFVVQGSEALPFLQRVLSNNAAALAVGESQYTLIPDDAGGALDDAYLYRFFEDRFLLVVNAANREKDWQHLESERGRYASVNLTDITHEMAMVSLQGPRSKALLSKLLDPGVLPEPRRNALSVTVHEGREILLARTGYTGEPLCFELFLPAEQALSLWNRLVELGAHPVGLGARDTLRLEAGLPLYGHELGSDPQGEPIPAFAMSLARFAVSFTPLKGDFVGKTALHRQYLALQGFMAGDFGRLADLPRMIRPVELLDKGIARAGARVIRKDAPAGWVTSGTMVPYWQSEGEGLASRPASNSVRRAVALALMDSRVQEGEVIEIDVRGKRLRAGVMPYLLRSEAPPYTRAYTWPMYQAARAHPEPADAAAAEQVRPWIQKAIDNHLWRQTQCINLIPSEQTPSPLVRMLSITDPSGRYAEHKTVKALADAEVFYYQGTDFIAAVEAALAEQLRLYLGCRQVETRPISGQMANMVVFSALVDYLNRADRKSEQRRIRMVMNHHIIKGGHLSAQPMGALRDYVSRDPVMEKPAVINFPALPHNPYDVDLAATRDLVERYRPDLIILGKSMTLHREPVAALRRIIDDLGLRTVLMYDMAHVLGLCGAHFQEPFKEGADLVTGSTHKTFFGPQRGIVAGNGDPSEPMAAAFWEAVERRTFPGAVSNHHLGTLLALLVATIEMNAFKDEYQPRVIANAKAFARALKQCGLEVAGDAAIGYTETHQVIVKVGYAQGPDIARRLEAAHIICNYQATAEEEGFTASGALRLGTAEMTRFGMRGPDFEALAQLMADAILHGKAVREAVNRLRRRFTEMHFCFTDQALGDLLQQLHRII